MSSFRPHSQAASLAAPHFAPVPAVRRRLEQLSGDSRLVHAAVSESGPVRIHNEDRWQAVAQVGLFVVADGMGGYAAGEIAAEIAVQTACRLIPLSLPPRLAREPAAGTSSRQPQPGVEYALRLAHDTCNAQILEYAADNPGCLGMGTTLVSCLIRDNRLHVAHVGDSRAYLLRDGKLKRLTRDHSVGQELLDGGSLTAAQLRHLPGRGILTRALGVEPTVDSDCGSWDWRVDDTLLICTDGVADPVDDERIRQLLIEAAAGGACAQAKALVAAALQAGGNDNATALVVRNAKDVGLRDDDCDCNRADASDSAGAVGVAGVAGTDRPVNAFDAAVAAVADGARKQEQARQAHSSALRNQELN
jgi:PPM family protein phosphatase